MRDGDAEMTRQLCLSDLVEQIGRSREPLAVGSKLMRVRLP